MKLPRADHYLVTTFFWPPARKQRTTLVPSLAARRDPGGNAEPGEHLLVYGRISGTVEAALKASGVPARIYGGRDGVTAGRARRQPALPALRERGVRRRPAHLPRRRRDGRLLADERGRLPAQADAGAPARGPVRAGDERPLPRAARLRHRVARARRSPRSSDFLRASRGYAEALAGYEQDGNCGARSTTVDRTSSSELARSNDLEIWRTLLLFAVGLRARRHRDRDRGRLRLGRAPAHLVPQARDSVGRVYGLVMGRRPLTGYHVFVFIIPARRLHLPFV